MPARFDDTINGGGGSDGASVCEQVLAHDAIGAQADMQNPPSPRAGGRVRLGGQDY
eukprot:CAMPEP_0176254976 /NCGR_PEP_ID=MMETSP0121_2-20121125/36806_1 /TAXON_ID=160619 /ORGANISM="Kryptoperidinium foliaceum, Strain CCMP 1326" /LENGTH=55 /DNA_ID=CAMNT_0017594795 /DNA_START=189 /DNA_END=354 /DNA_ORIENTATION=+